nr:A/G-specific adenine glycosylase [uncultured Prevotella sp.]
MFASTIVSWFGEYGRDLPWRHTKDAYAIWLSEVILQQTRIVQGQAYWERMMERWPSVEALAAASEDEVLRMWQGLGYYSRARNLHEAARQVVAMGRFPDSLKGIKALKGVGDYTAAAIACFAFGVPAAVVDGNVYRVLARYFDIDVPINSSQGKRVFAELAQSLLPQSEAVAYNQGIMDFGAMVCTPMAPRCAECPLMLSCAAFRSGRVDVLPVKLKTVKVRERHLAYVFVRCWERGDGVPMTAIHRRSKGDIWQGLWEPFNASVADERASSPEEIARMLYSKCSEVDGAEVLLRQGEGFSADMDFPAGKCDSKLPVLRLVAKGVKHVLTHRILLVDFYVLDVTSRPALPDGYVWVSEEELERYAMPKVIVKYVPRISD